MNKMKKVIIGTATTTILGLIALLWHSNTVTKISVIETRSALRETTFSEDLNSAKDTTTSEAYSSPIDFASWKQANSDIYAWLDIPGTIISYPILQHASDDTFYLRRGYDKAYDIAGSLFTEHQYNNNDFTDAVTIIYGHNMDDGSMFGNLQKCYSSITLFQEMQKIVVYLPDHELHFNVFAAVPFENWHILYNYNFLNKRMFQNFFNTVFSVRAIDAMFDTDIMISPEDQVLILSTCLQGNSNRRYLVCAKLVQEIK